jgi:hypothetical protein
MRRGFAARRKLRLLDLPMLRAGHRRKKGPLWQNPQGTAVSRMQLRRRRMPLLVSVHRVRRAAAVAHLPVVRRTRGTYRATARSLYRRRNEQSDHAAMIRSLNRPSGPVSALEQEHFAPGCPRIIVCAGGSQRALPCPLQTTRSNRGRVDLKALGLAASAG